MIVWTLLIDNSVVLSLPLLVINLLITLSEAGNHVATILLQNINNTIDNMTQELNKEISNLNSLVKYKDFSEIFDSTLSLGSLNELPISIIQETINLNNKLSQLITEIENGGMKKNLSTLHDNIYEFTVSEEWTYDLRIVVTDKNSWIEDATKVIKFTAKKADIVWNLTVTSSENDTKERKPIFEGFSPLTVILDASKTEILIFL